MTQTELLALAKSCGFTASAPLDPASIELKQAVRDMCKENTCGQYGKRWSCPPGCGNLEQCRTQLSGYSTGLLVQTTGAIEDSFDFEGIQAIEQQHKLHFDVCVGRLLQRNVHTDGGIIHPDEDRRDFAADDRAGRMEGPFLKHFLPHLV